MLFGNSGAAYPEDVLCFGNGFFIRVIHQDGGRLWELVLEAAPDRGTMLAESFEVLELITGSMVEPHSPEHFEPALAQAAQGTGVAVALVAFGLVVALGPAAGFAAFFDPPLDARPQTASPNQHAL